MKESDRRYPAVTANQVDIHAGKLAQITSTNAGVKAFAERMIIAANCAPSVGEVERVSQSCITGKAPATRRTPNGLEW